MTYVAATQPTLYFVGVTTGRSAIMRVFPAWARHLGLRDAVIRGIDFPLHTAASAYREAVAFMRDDPLSRGALVTTHKIDLFKACRDLFDVIDPYAAAMDETSCISKRGGGLVCHAKDPISSALALEGLLPPDHFARTAAEMFVIGAGGSGIAITSRLRRRERGGNAPSRLVVSDRSQTRLDEIRRIHRGIGFDLPAEYVLTPRPADNDAVLATLTPGSLVVNATGLGKDAPGSPLNDRAEFPQSGIAWDLNYRGDLVFLDQARAQRERRGLRIENGFDYFIHGWTQVIAEVFQIAIPTSGPAFDALRRIAVTRAETAPPD